MQYIAHNVMLLRQKSPARVTFKGFVPSLSLAIFYKYIIMYMLPLNCFLKTTWYLISPMS